MHRRTWLRILEFVVAGILLDLAENMVVFKVSAGRSLALEEVGVAILVIVPFAVISELIIDHPRFWHKVLHLKEIKEEVRS